MIYDPIGSDPPTGGAIFQTGDIPLNAVRVEMLVTNVLGIRVSLNGVSIPLDVIETVGGIQRVSGDISDFAGTNATLRITSPFGEADHLRSAIDAIEFAVPEPTSVTAYTLGLIVLVALRRLEQRRWDQDCC